MLESLKRFDNGGLIGVYCNTAVKHYLPNYYIDSNSSYSIYCEKYDSIKNIVKILYDANCEYSIKFESGTIFHHNNGNYTAALNTKVQYHCNMNKLAENATLSFDEVKNIIGKYRYYAVMDAKIVYLLKNISIDIESQLDIIQMIPIDEIELLMEHNIPFSVRLTEYNLYHQRIFFANGRFQLLYSNTSDWHRRYLEESFNHLKVMMSI